MSFEKPIGGAIRYLFVNMRNYWGSEPQPTLGNLS